ncbi:Cleavage stimulation factor subunit 1 [Acropora cervicornis]|uniref:One cut domain family member n=1 Tax=Acropora cervicornis TaxID=6130 RepID=A0AAD9PY85_ACRCE|nr:Cleavage stimulation factor subunit 1 [Acropora cervicornis]
MAAMTDSLKERENLYKLMIRFSATIFKLIHEGFMEMFYGARPEQPAVPGLTPQVETNRGIDLEYEPEGNEASGEWQRSSSADELFMSNLELQKIDREAGKGKEDDSPSADAVIQHIFKITSNRKLSHFSQLRDPKPLSQASNNVVTQNSDVVDAEGICEQVKIELIKYSISQEVFAKAVLGKSQGYLSEMLKHGESFFRPQDHTHYKGWLNFETMRQFLQKPEAERLQIYYQKGEELKMERLKRRQLEVGLTEEMAKKKRRIIPMQAKAVMEDYYNNHKYLSMEKRQILANQLAIPEQCVSDYFKNLRSRKKHEDNMTYLLQEVGNDDKHLEQGDSETESAKNHLPSCSGISMEPTVHSGKSTLHLPSMIPQCGRRTNIAPRVFSEVEGPLAKGAPEIDLVESKIASLTQCQKGTPKQQQQQEVKCLDTASRTDVCPEVSKIPPSTTCQPSAQEDLAGGRNGVLSRESSTGADTVQTFSFDTLIDGSMMLHEGSSENEEALDVGRQIYSTNNTHKGNKVHVDQSTVDADHGTSPPAAMYETYYVTAHKGPCRTASFSQNGRLIATGSMDASIKVLDVERMVAKNTMPQSQDQSSGTNLENHPVIRTLYDHMEEVTSVEFHPSALVLASGSKDCTVKLFDISKPSVKKAYRSIQIHSLPSPLLACGASLFIKICPKVVRLYDTNTGQCFVSANPREYHTGPINMVMYSPTANLFASCSKDGAIKIWDGVSNKCIQTFPQAHNGAEVYSICFSQNSKYVVSSGNDSLVFLWELSTVFVADESNNSIACWDTRTTEKLKTLSSGHNNHIRCLAHSPTGAAFVSCSDDYRARFWYCQGV